MATAYPVLKIAGINLDDPSGRWHVLPGTSILPNFPGRTETKVSVPGLTGYRAVSYAPGEALKVSIVMRFNAVQTYANTIVLGNEGARIRAISQNIDTFFYATALARQGYSGLVQISKELTAGEVRVANGRMVGATEANYDTGGDYATMTLVFEIPSGVWLDQKYTIFQGQAQGGGKISTFKIPAGTAPQVENVVAMKGPYGSPSTPTSFANELGIGFNVGFADANINMASNDWMVVNCQTWRNSIVRGLSGNYPTIAWGNTKGLSQVEPKGRPVGSALTLLPSRDRGYATLRVHSQTAVRFQLRTRRAWY